MAGRIGRDKLSPILMRVVNRPPPSPVVRFGVFQMDLQAGQLLKNGRVVRLKPQPFRLLELLVSRAGDVVTREEIREVLWGSDTFVDFDQGVNSAIKQVREALNEDADRPLYVETVPRRGYRFIAPVEPHQRRDRLDDDSSVRLQKALWQNVAELRMAEARRRRLAMAAAVVLAVAGAAAYLLMMR